MTIKKARWYRVGLMMFLVYVVAFLDRNNISMGAPSMVKDLHLSATVTGVLLSAFFWGYVLTQIPGGWLASKFSAKRVIVIGMTVWGIASMLTGLVTNYNLLLCVRFLVGFSEGVVWPSFMVLVTNWFPDSERAKAVNFAQTSSVIAPIIMSPLSGWMIAKWDYKEMFVLQGIPPIVVAILFGILVADSPSKDRFLSAEERQFLIENRSTSEKESGTFLEVISNLKIWLFAFIYFLWITGMYGFGLWLPSLIKQLSSSGIEAVGWMSAIPYVFAAIAMYLTSSWSDRRGLNRGLFVAFPMLLAGLSLLIEHLLPSDQLVLNMILLVLTAVGIYAGFGSWWAWMLTFVPRNQAGVSSGFINLCGNLGGIVGPIVVGIAASGGNVMNGFYILGAGLVVNFILLTFVARKFKVTGESEETEATRLVH